MIRSAGPACATVVCALQILVAVPSAMASDAVTYVAREYAFTGPDTLPGGWTTVTLLNRGKDLHQIQFIKLPAGKTAEDLHKAILHDSSRLPPWVQRRSGPNSVAPAEQATVVIHLDAGEYVLLCGIPDKQGLPHVARGMLKPLRVTADPPHPAAAPSSDQTLTLEDFKFSVPRPFTAGPNTIRVFNTGTQAHEVVVVKLAPGASVNDFLDTFRPGVVVSPAGKPIGGLVGLDPGHEGYVQADFAPGRYGLICFLPDFLTRGPHFARGMLLDIDVR